MRLFVLLLRTHFERQFRIRRCRIDGVFAKPPSVHFEGALDRAKKPPSEEEEDTNRRY